MKTGHLIKTGNDLLNQRILTYMRTRTTTTYDQLWPKLKSYLEDRSLFVRRIHNLSYFGWIELVAKREYKLTAKGIKEADYWAWKEPSLKDWWVERETIPSPRPVETMTHQDTSPVGKTFELSKPNPDPIPSLPSFRETVFGLPPAPAPERKEEKPTAKSAEHDWQQLFIDLAFDMVRNLGKK